MMDACPASPCSSVMLAEAAAAANGSGGNGGVVVGGTTQVNNSSSVQHNSVDESTGVSDSKVADALTD